MGQLGEPPVEADRFSVSFSSFLDLSRWCAALVVFLGHLRNPIVVGWPELPPDNKEPWVLGWYFITGLDHEAVIVFFVLSGFLVGGIGLNKSLAGRFSLSDYAIDRGARLFVAFIPAVFLGVGLDLLGSHLFGWTGLWNHGHDLMRNNFPTQVFADNLTPQIIGGNLVMLQSFMFPPVGSNQPLWSLSFEFWFYVIFACFAVAFARRSWVMGTAMAACVVLVIVVFLGARLPLLMVMWIVGAAAFAYRGSLLRRPLLAAAVFCATLVGSRLWGAGNVGWSVYLSDYCVAAGFAWLLVAWRHRCGWLLEKTMRFNKFMADFSYSLYLIHFPLMLFVLAALATTFGLDDFPKGYAPADYRALLLYGCTAAIVIATAYVFAWMTERRTGAVRMLLKAYIRRTPA